MTDTAIRTNKFAAACAKCKGWVPKGAGILSGSRATGWKTTHAGECPPPRGKAENAAPGYYIRPTDGRAVVVKQSKKHKDRTYGLVLTFPSDGGRPSWDYVRGAGYTVANLRPMTAADAAALGLSHGYCIFCCAPLGGETLAAACSALIGYGETCSKRHGFPYPKGVKAQREYIATHGS